MRARRPHGADRGARQRPGTSRSTPCATPPTPSSRPVRRLRRRSRSAARPASTGCAGAGDATLSGLSLLLRPGPPPRADLLDAARVLPPAGRLAVARAALPGGPAAGAERSGAGSFGWVVVPEEVWVDLARFEGWVEDAVVLRRAALTAEMNPGLSLADALVLVLARDADPAVGRDVRAGIARSRRPLACVWTGRGVDAWTRGRWPSPWSARGRDDIRNLPPADRRAVARKSDGLPSRRPPLARREAIVGRWRADAALRDDRFAEQAERGPGRTRAGPTGPTPPSRGWARRSSGSRPAAACGAGNRSGRHPAGPVVRRCHGARPARPLCDHRPVGRIAPTAAQRREAPA